MGNLLIENKDINMHSIRNIKGVAFPCSNKSHVKLINDISGIQTPPSHHHPIIFDEFELHIKAIVHSPDIVLL